jgi:DnaJ-class molecular chaperone
MERGTNLNEDLYQLLGVSRDANSETLRAAFRSRARVFHPDRGTGSNESFAKIEYAYRVLSDPAKRRLYDLLLDAGMVQGTETDRPAAELLRP